MKKVITLVLAIALLMTSVVAIAETHATPNINSFAKMTVKIVGAQFKQNSTWSWNPKNNDSYYEITLSKPVDRLLINWTGKGEEPEELAVDENLKATAICWGHKQMPGTTQTYITRTEDGRVLNNRNTYTVTASVVGYNVTTSEVVYKKGLSTSPYYADPDKTTAYEVIYNYPQITLDPNAPLTVADQITSYLTEFGCTINDVTIVLPYQNVNPTTGVTTNVDGYIQRNSVTTNPVDPEDVQSVIATPADTAYMTVQGEWAVYYNRAGKIVGIEYFDGQF